MSRFVLTPQANLDITSIWEFIAEDNVTAADKVLTEIEKTLHILADQPNMGFIREEWADSRHRFWPVYSYIVMYRPDTSPLQVLRIVSGFQDLCALLKK